MLDKNKKGLSFGLSSILATSMLTLGGSLIGAVSYLSLEYLSAGNIPQYDGMATFEKSSADPSPELPETSGKEEWASYTSETYGFSFQYPKDWKITKDLFSEDFVLVLTNKNHSFKASGEIKVEALKEADLMTEKDPSGTSENEDAVYSYETSFSHIVNLAGKDKKEFVRLQYLEMDNNGARIQKDDWKYFDIYKKITDSFAFTSK